MFYAHGIGPGLASQIAGRVYPRMGPRRMLTVGLPGVGAVTALMTTVGSVAIRTAGRMWLHKS